MTVEVTSLSAQLIAALTNSPSLLSSCTPQFILSFMTSPPFSSLTRPPIDIHQIREWFS